MQPNISGPLDPAYLKLITTQLEMAHNNSMDVIVDCHNFAGVHTLRTCVAPHTPTPTPTPTHTHTHAHTHTRTLTHAHSHTQTHTHARARASQAYGEKLNAPGGNVTSAAFADLWRRLATEIKDMPALHGCEPLSFSCALAFLHSHSLILRLSDSRIRSLANECTLPPHTHTHTHTNTHTHTHKHKHNDRTALSAHAMQVRHHERAEQHANANRMAQCSASGHRRHPQRRHGDTPLHRR
jgi:hypothetical protein